MAYRIDASYDPDRLRGKPVSPSRLPTEKRQLRASVGAGDFEAAIRILEGSNSVAVLLRDLLAEHGPDSLGSLLQRLFNAAAQRERGLDERSSNIDERSSGLQRLRQLLEADRDEIAARNQRTDERERRLDLKADRLKEREARVLPTEKLASAEQALAKAQAKLIEDREKLAEAHETLKMRGTEVEAQLREAGRRARSLEKILRNPDFGREVLGWVQRERVEALIAHALRELGD